MKAGKMQEWWSKAHQLLLDMNLKKEDIEKAVELSDIRLRDYSMNLINYCRDHKVPFLLFSAGLAVVLEVGIFVDCSININTHTIGGSSSEMRY